MLSASDLVISRVLLLERPSGINLGDLAQCAAPLRWPALAWVLLITPTHAALSSPIRCADESWRCLTSDPYPAGRPAHHNRHVTGISVLRCLRPAPCLPEPTTLHRLCPPDCGISTRPPQLLISDLNVPYQLQKDNNAAHTQEGHASPVEANLGQEIILAWRSEEGGGHSAPLMRCGWIPSAPGQEDRASIWISQVRE